MAVGLQTIIDNASDLLIDRRKVVGVQITRNEIPRTSLTPTRQPWRFELTMPNRLRYYNNRDVLEALDTIDRYTPQIITFSNNSLLSWIFKYQGSLSATQLSGITVQSFIGNTLRLTGLPVTSSTTVMFKPNDLIQIGNYTYPFTSTTTITRGSAAYVDITTNRPNIISGPGTPWVGNGITVGNTCKFNMFCPNMPTYKLIPGGYMESNGVTVNNALIEFSGTFDLYEWVGAA